MPRVFPRPHPAAGSRTRVARVMLLVALSLGPAALARPITRAEAVQQALAGQPALRRAAADVGIADGRLRGAHTYRFNPEIGASISPVHVGGMHLFYDQVSLDQILELGGKRGKRVEVARAELDAARARSRWTRRAVVLRVERAYDLAALDRAIVAAAHRAVAAADAAKAATQERLEQRVGTQLEVNVAAANAGRARQALFGAEQTYTEARGALGAAIGAPPGEDLEPSEPVAPPPAPARSEAELVAAALASRADLQATRLDREAASAAVSLADAQVIPDVALSLSYARQPDIGVTYDIFSVGASVPLPIFQRNQGERAAARSALRRAEVDAQAARWDAERDLRAAYRAYAQARAAVQAFDVDVVGKLDENLALARESFQAGKIGALDLNVVQRELVDTQVAYLEARRTAVEARFALELAAGDVEVFR